MKTSSARTPLQWIVVSVFGLNATSAFALPPKGSQQPPIEAIWHVQAFPFEYHSLSTYYDCEALEQRLRAMLDLMGARQPIVIHSSCGAIPAKQIRVQIIVATPVPATEENVRAATEFDSNDELVARMRGGTLPTAADLERFPARRQRRHVRISHGDCDLMRGIHEQIVPKLAMRSASRKVNCPRITSLRTRMEYEALIAVPATTG